MTNAKIAMALMFLSLGGCLSQQEKSSQPMGQNVKDELGCQTWRDYVSAVQSGESLPLPDYSYAGYQYAEKGIPDIHGPLFNVVDFGAVANDEHSDRLPIHKAIKAAEDHGGGVVFFPPGRFLVNEKKGVAKGFEISSSNIVLRGSGCGEGGTEIFMKHHLMPKNPKQKWSVPAMFSFVHENRSGRSFTTSKFSVDQGEKPVAAIVSDARAGSKVLKVDDASRIKAGDVLAVRMQNTEANDLYLEDRCARDIWSDVLTKGVVICEKLEVESVHGNELHLVAPIHSAVEVHHGWSVYSYSVAEGWGVEDIHFRGNFQEEFVHHKDFIHDSGWNMVSMSRGKNCWIRRCRLSDMSVGFSFSGCLASSMLMNSVEGNRGHSSFVSKWGQNNLIGLSRDITNKGTYHGPGFSHQNAGGVVWRYRSHVGGGPDFHAYCPHTSLWDQSRASAMENGGNYKMQPNHLGGLTFWNFERTDQGKALFDFWALPMSDMDQKKKYYGGVKIVNPNVIGYHGTPTVFQSTGLSESIGQAVEPESLYEAQLALRLGKLPDWVENSKLEWQSIQHVSGM
jgi:hypothetical protein